MIKQMAIRWFIRLFHCIHCPFETELASQMLRLQIYLLRLNLLLVNYSENFYNFGKSFKIQRRFADKGVQSNYDIVWIRIESD